MVDTKSEKSIYNICHKNVNYSNLSVTQMEFFNFAVVAVLRLALLMAVISCRQQSWADPARTLLLQESER